MSEGFRWFLFEADFDEQSITVHKIRDEDHLKEIVDFDEGYQPSVEKLSELLVDGYWYGEWIKMELVEVKNG